MMAAGVIVVLFMLIIELPTVFLDFFMIINIIAGLLIILTVLFLTRASDFFVFPSLLLATTLFRLAINVSSTRLILTKGRNFDGKLVQAFGEFVIGDRIVVGFVIFIILVIVQFLVITKGASRIAEVAARFTLDAMPGKQMAIDADLNAGLVDEEGAKKRRAQVAREAEFYGAMDGASKFVSGDVIVGLIITAINIVGGVIIGMTTDGMSPLEAFNLFGKFTVGDGLIAQIPTLLISTATGMLITRAGQDDSSLGADLKAQLFNDPKVLFIVAVFLVVAAFIPRFPTALLLLTAAVVFSIGIAIFQTQKQAVAEGPLPGTAGDDVEKPIDVTPAVDPIEIIIGYNLIPLVDKEQGGDLLDRITMARQQLAQTMGFVVPPIRIRDDVKLGPSEYCINIRGVEVDRFVFKENKLLAMVTQEIVGQGLLGEEVEEPAFHMKALWINEEQRESAESLGYTVVDLPTIIATHLTEVVKRNSNSILSREDVKKLVDHMKETQGTLVDEFLNIKGALGVLQKVLQKILSEGLSIKDLVTILERIIDYQHLGDVDLITERVRQGLSRMISHKYALLNADVDRKTIPVLTLSPEVDLEIGESISETDEGLVSTLDADTIRSLVEAINREVESVRQQGKVPVLLCSARIRLTLKQIVGKFIPFLDIISYPEVADGYETETLGVVTI